jgi:hypothetical protein
LWDIGGVLMEDSQETIKTHYMNAFACIFVIDPTLPVRYIFIINHPGRRRPWCSKTMVPTNHRKESEYCFRVMVAFKFFSPY